MPQGTGRKVQLKAGGSLGAGSSKRGLVSFGFCYAKTSQREGVQLPNCLTWADFEDEHGEVSDMGATPFSPTSSKPLVYNLHRSKNPCSLLSLLQETHLEPSHGAAPRTWQEAVPYFAGLLPL